MAQILIDAAQNDTYIYINMYVCSWVTTHDKRKNYSEKENKTSMFLK